MREFGLSHSFKSIRIAIFCVSLLLTTKQIYTVMAILTRDKVTEIYCIVDDFCKYFASEYPKTAISDKAKRTRNRKATLSDSEIMTILLGFHFGTYRDFKHYYLCCICEQFCTEFPKRVSYNRFIELSHRVAILLPIFLKLVAFGKPTGISFVDSTCIPVCHLTRRYSNKVFKGFATVGKSTMSWYYGFKLHLICNDKGELLNFCLTKANTDDRASVVWDVLSKNMFGKVFADRGYISQKLFEHLFDQGIHIVTGLRANMKNKLMPMWDKILLRKRYIIECINDYLKNTAQIVHSRHRSITGFMINLMSAMGAYCFFDNKVQAFKDKVETTKKTTIWKQA